MMCLSEVSLLAWSPLYLTAVISLFDNESVLVGKKSAALLVVRGGHSTDQWCSQC